ncbi:MAG: WD40 repeat domain-containing protein, partial [Cyanobacteria bacterium J06636_27]
KVLAALQDVVHTIRERNSLEAHEGGVSRVNFSRNGKILASGGADGEVKIWSRDGRDLERTFQAHEQKVTSISFSPDGKKLITGSEDNTLKLWNLQGKQLGKTFKGHKDIITSIAFSPDSQKVVSGSEDRTVKIWDLDGKVIKNLDKHEGSITCVIFSPDGELIASGSEDRTLKLWDLKGKIIQNFNHSDTVNSISFSSDGKEIASAYQQFQLFSPEINTFINLWRRDGTLIKRINAFRQTPPLFLKKIKYSIDNRKIALAGVSLLERFGDSIYIELVDTNTEKTDNFFLQGHQNRVTDISFSPNLQILASASQDTNIKLWNIETRKDRKYFKAISDSVKKVNFVPNGQLITSVKNNSDLELDTKVKILQPNKNLITTLPGLNSSFGFSADSRMLVSASQDSKIQLRQRDNAKIKNLQGMQVDESL